MKNIFIVGILIISILLTGCSSSNSKWTFSDKDRIILINDAKAVKENFDMYVEKEERGLDYSKELEQNVELSEAAKNNAKEIRNKYDGKLTKEEISMLADLSLSYRYLRNKFKSDDDTAIHSIDTLQEKILRLEEE
jgi:major membrane immunogen (membrane-anchored lipoprotein)